MTWPPLTQKNLCRPYWDRDLPPSPDNGVYKADASASGGRIGFVDNMGVHSMNLVSPT